MSDRSAGERAAPGVVAVTGAAGYVGRCLIARLLRDGAVRRIVGIDLRPSPLRETRYTHVRQDVRAPLDGLFRQARVEAVVHLAFVLRPPRDRAAAVRTNVGGATNVLRASEAAAAGRVVLLSSATVYGPRADGAGMLDEEAAVLPPRGFAYAEDKAACEAQFLRFRDRHPGTDVSILRACVVMGPTAHNFITAALDRPVLLGIRGADPQMQFVHEDDLAAVLARCTTESHPGVYNAAGPGSLRWSEVVSMAGKRRLSLPAPLAHGLTGLSWLSRLQSDAPAAGLALIRWPWTVSTAKLDAELGHPFAHSSRDALAAYLRARRRDGDSPGDPDRP